jgi:uncharacterized protein YlzI (FlbEa/FlbD family)
MYENWWKTYDYILNVHHLGETIENHPETCETCRNGDECGTIGEIRDELFRNVLTLHKLVVSD